MKYSTKREGNSYFNGSDVRVYDDETGHNFLLNLKDGMWAFSVKEYSGLPSDVDGDKLTDDEIEGCAQMARDGWWNDAEIVAKEFGFEDVWAGGRSGGWCCVDGTQTWEPGWLLNPDDFFDAEEEDAKKDAEEDVERFCKLAFKLRDELIPFWREQFHRYLRERIEENAEAEELRSRQTRINAVITWPKGMIPAKPDLKPEFVQHIIIGNGLRAHGFRIEDENGQPSDEWIEVTVS